MVDRSEPDEGGSEDAIERFYEIREAFLKKLTDKRFISEEKYKSQLTEEIQKLREEIIKKTQTQNYISSERFDEISKQERILLNIREKNNDINTNRDKIRYKMEEENKQLQQIVDDNENEIHKLEKEIGVLCERLDGTETENQRLIDDLLREDDKSEHEQLIKKVIINHEIDSPVDGGLTKVIASAAEAASVVAERQNDPTMFVYTCENLEQKIHKAIYDDQKLYQLAYNAFGGGSSYNTRYSEQYRQVLIQLFARGDLTELITEFLEDLNISEEDMEVAQLIVYAVLDSRDIEFRKNSYGIAEIVV